jgi:hypothetical protein
VSPEPRGAPLARQFCQVVGTNVNYLSKSGTLYHIQIEDRGPVMDRVTESSVRRVNTIVYANYGEPNARIIYGRDQDYSDIRTHEHNRLVTQKIQELAVEARQVIEEKERRIVARIKHALRDYHKNKDEAAKREFEDANSLYPFLFSKAWSELKAEREEASQAAEELNQETVYPLDVELRELVIDIERIVADLGADLEALKEQGSADDILLQTCRKLVARAQESLQGSPGVEYNVKRLEMTRNSLITTWKQVRSRMRKPGS